MKTYELVKEINEELHANGDIFYSEAGNATILNDCLVWEDSYIHVGILVGDDLEWEKVDVNG